jgi:parvulin-like peptidyl-prolyl isomerase
LQFDEPAPRAPVEDDNPLRCAAAIDQHAFSPERAGRADDGKDERRLCPFEHHARRRLLELPDQFSGRDVCDAHRLELGALLGRGDGQGDSKTQGDHQRPSHGCLLVCYWEAAVLLHLRNRRKHVLRSPRMRRFVAVAMLLLAIACRQKPATPPDVIARVGERMLTLADFKRYLERNTGTDLAQMAPEVASALLDQYMEEIVLSEYAATHGVEVPADIIAQAVRNEAGATVIEKRDQMRREKLIASVATEVPEASDAQVAEYYDRHQSEFQSSDEVRVRQILVHDEALATDIVSKLKKGAAFEDLSRKHSRAPNAKKGGEIGFVSRGELPKMFEDEIFALSAGGVSTPIRTDNSFHIFKVDERRPAGLVELQAAAPVIRARLREDALRDRLAQLVSQARRDMQIAILTKRLPFRYSGTLPRIENE